MKRLTSLLILTSLLVTALSSGFVPPARTQQLSMQQYSPYAEPSSYSMATPQDAVVGSTAERQQAWDSLTPEEQDQAMQEFRSLVEPDVNQAQADHEYQASSKASYAQEESMAQTVQRDAASDTDTSGDATLNFMSDYGYTYTTDEPVTPMQEIGATLAPSIRPDESIAPSMRPIPCDGCDPPPPNNLPPHVSATASPNTGTAPLTVQFNANASDPDGYIDFYSWNFGDGATAYDVSPVHTYTSAGSYTARVTVTDDGGRTASASLTITVTSGTPTGGGADADADGLPDAFENQLADSFTPVYFVSAGERSGSYNVPESSQAGTGFATFYDFTPQTIQRVFAPVPPISHFRVTKVGISSNGLGLLEIDYLTLWNRDDGTPVGLGCLAGLDLLLGSTGDRILGSLHAHEFDNERSAVLVAAPTVNGTYNTDMNSYYLYDVFTSAHEGTFTDKSRYKAPSQPQPAGAHVLLALSRAKHSTYTFNPDHLPLTPTYIIVATYSTLYTLYRLGRISYVRYLIYLYIADSVFYSCFVEHFQDQGGTFAGTRINVGETNHPINASSFIQDTQPNPGSALRPKLDRLLWRAR